MRTSCAILGQKYLFLMMVSVFSTPWKTCIATPYPYYMNKESTLFWTSKLLDFQTKRNTANFFMDLFNVLDRKIFKYNTIHVYSPTSAGKNFVVLKKYFVTCWQQVTTEKSKHKIKRNNR